MALGADGAVAADGVVSPPKLRDMKLCATPKEMTHLPSFVSERVAMIVPTSLCSSQVSQKLTNRLNDAKAAKEANLDRVVTLPHTEGCGASSGDSENMFIRTILGYAVHPLVSAVFLRLARRDAFRRDSHPHEVDTQAREPACRHSAERWTIVRPYRLW